MRRANKTGCVSKLPGKRHKPWAVKITIGYDEDGRQIRKYAGYFATKKEAQLALDHLLHNPIESKRMTLKEAWEGWSAAYTGSPNTISAYKAAYKRAYLLHDKDLSEIALDDMQAVADQEPLTYARAKNVQKVFSALLEYGFAHDACPAGRKDLLKYLQLPPSRQKRGKEDKRFTDDEIQSVIDQHCILAVILICTGLRRSELIGLVKEDIDLDRQMIMVRQSKTENGIRRVPIPDRLIPWIEEYIESGAIGKSRMYLDHHLWNPFDTFDHVKHHCRHTYISVLTESGADERMVKTLAGHAGGVTLDVYTHYKDETLIDTVNRAFARYLPVIENGEESYSDRLSA